MQSLMRKPVRAQAPVNSVNKTAVVILTEAFNCPFQRTAIRALCSYIRSGREKRR